MDRESLENINSPAARFHAERIYEKSDSARCFEGFELIYNIVWTVIFWVKIGETEQATCGGSVWFWANYAKYYFLAMSVISAIQTCCFFNPPTRGSFIDRIKLDTLINGLFGVFRVAGAILVIGILVTYTQVEQCPNLSEIMLVQFWIIVAIFGIGTALCSFSVYCLRSDVQVLKSQPNTPRFNRAGSLTDNFHTFVRMASRRDDYSPV